MPERKYIDIKEFKKLGYLQEANRRFFHPLGLALEVTERPEEKAYLSGILDNRDDLEGFMFTIEDKEDMAKKTNYIAKEWRKRLTVRMKMFGWMVQDVLFAGKEKVCRK